MGFPGISRIHVFQAGGHSPLGGDGVRSNGMGFGHQTNAELGIFSRGFNGGAASSQTTPNNQNVMLNHGKTAPTRLAAKMKKDHGWSELSPGKTVVL